MESNHDKFCLKKHKSNTYNVELLDRTSSLPDEIVVLILSNLSIKEAARSSILSRRWEKLWKSFQGNLEFDVRNKLRNVARSKWPQITCDHLKSMNQLLRLLLCSSPLNSLIFRCQYRKTQLLEFEFDTIVQFLMAKRRIRILEFDTNPMEVQTDFFTFPAQFYDWIKQPRGLHTISALTSLSFNMVDLTDDTVAYFVSNCPLLERLCVRRSELLYELRITGDASLKLKYLEIQGFSVTMKSIVVSAPNLVSLDVRVGCYAIKLNVSNVPKLVEVAIGEHIMTYMSGSLSTYLAQIHSLKLLFTTFEPLTPLAPNNVVFSSLKHLVLRGTILQQDSRSLLRFTSSLVEASPMLEKFTFSPLGSFRDEKTGLHQMTNPTPTRQQYPQNQRLKVVELTGFKGATLEVELFLYFVQNFSSLGQIVIDTTTSSLAKIIPETPNEILKLRKERAMQLVKHIPRGVHFLLI